MFPIINPIVCDLVFAIDYRHQEECFLLNKLNNDVHPCLTNQWVFFYFETISMLHNALHYRMSKHMSNTRQRFFSHYHIPSSLGYKAHFSRQLNCWSLRCSLSIACWRCSNYIFILCLTLGLNILHKDNCKPGQEIFKRCYGKHRCIRCYSHLYAFIVKTILSTVPRKSWYVDIIYIHDIWLHVHLVAMNRRVILVQSITKSYWIYCNQMPLLLTWFNFNPGIDK